MINCPRRRQRRRRGGFRPSANRRRPNHPSSRERPKAPTLRRGRLLQATTGDANGVSLGAARRSPCRSIVFAPLNPGKQLRWRSFPTCTQAIRATNAWEKQLLKCGAIELEQLGLRPESASQSVELAALGLQGPDGARPTPQILSTAPGSPRQRDHRRVTGLTTLSVQRL